MRLPFSMPSMGRATVWLTFHALNVLISTAASTMELTGLSWLSIELLDGRVNTDSRNCFIISTFIHPKVILMLEDAEATVQTRTVSYTVETESVPTPSGTNAANLPSWPIVSSEPFVTYYGRNASFMTELVGHDPRFKDPLKTSQILANSSRIALPLSQEYVVLKMGAECYNITVAIRELSFLDLVPTTTPDPNVLRGAQFVYDASKMSNTTASLPFWSVALVSALLLIFIVAFVVLLFVHLQSKRRISKMTIQHETSGCLKKQRHNNSHSNNNNHLKPPASNCSSSSSNGIVRSSSIESHYDVPWEHKFRPLPDWLRTDLATALTDGAPKTVPVKPVPCPRGMGTADSGVESLSS